ncbi:hypothetical protein NEOKW01_0270 [Nematocida sp. AWRm80]|nr:hypothetical protein NEOKW01_0270 [Nematocida sp. AWRm80]
MKYLELECISRVSPELSQIEESVFGLTLRLEAYSLKKTKKERKDTKCGKYKTIPSMVSAAINLMFFGYEIDIFSEDLEVVSETEYKSTLLSKLFTLGITKNYLEMSAWIDGLFRIIEEAAGKDIRILRVTKRTGPFEKCNWSECMIAYGKELKRVVALVILYAFEPQSPLL